VVGGIRFSLEELIHIPEKRREFFETLRQLLEEEEKARAEKWAKELEEAWKKLEKVKKVKPKKVKIVEEEPLLSQQRYEKLKKVYEKLVEEKEAPEWVLELLEKLRETKVPERKLVIQTRPVVIKRLLRGEFPYAQRVALAGVSEEWHFAFILPFKRRFLQYLGLTKEKWKLSDEVDLEIRFPDGRTVKVKGYYAITPLAHSFFADKPFLYAVIPINAPRLDEATVKAVVIYNYHSEPLRLRILHQMHGTEDVVEVPPDHIFIFIHKFVRSLAYLRKKAEIESKIEELKKELSPEVAKTVEKYYRKYSKAFGRLMTYEEIYNYLAEKAREELRRRLQKLVEEVRKKLRGWIII